MPLSDIAADLEVVEEQRERGVAAIDDTGGSLAERLEPFADDLPCSAPAAATAVEAYAGGAQLPAAADAAGLAPVTAARTLHLLGVGGVSPLPPEGHETVRAWLDGERSRTEAKAATGASERAFALAAFVETHEPLAGARETVECALAPGGDRNAAVEKRDALDGTHSDVDDLL